MFSRPETSPPSSSLSVSKVLSVSCSRDSVVLRSNTPRFPSVRLALNETSNPSSFSWALAVICMATSCPTRASPSVSCVMLRVLISIETGRSGSFGKVNGFASASGSLFSSPAGRRAISMRCALNSSTSRRPRNSAERFQSRTTFSIVSQTPSASEMVIWRNEATELSAPSKSMMFTSRPAPLSRS